MGVASSGLGKQSTARDVVTYFATAANVEPGSLLKGKTALVTGAASGIGTETVKALTSAGCRVLATARNAATGDAAIKAYVASSADGYAGDASLVTTLAVELSDLASVKSLATAVLAAAPVIDIIVLNAGIMASPKLELTAAGFEKQIGISHMAHHLLVSLLRERIENQPAGARIVYLSSLAHKSGKVDVNDLHFTKGRKYAPWHAYGQSKKAVMLDAKELSDQLSSKPVVAVSVHPGVIATNLARDIPFIKGDGVVPTVARSFFNTFIVDKSIPQGAATTLYACLEPRLAEPALRGSYLADCAVAAPDAEAEDAGKTLRKALWAVTEEQLAAALAKL